MTWVGLLLADSSPCLRYLVLRDLLARPIDDDELQELAALRATDPRMVELVSTQARDGSWGEHGGNRLRATALALARLDFLGFGPDQPSVAAGAAFLFAQQRTDGSWALPQERESERESGEGREGYSMAPLQTAIPLRGLASCGYATDPRAERAFDWLLAQRLSDGAWPTGIASGNYGYVAGYRKLAHSRWGCRSNTTGVLNCLALHPERRHSAEARRALDLLLGRETYEAHTLGFEVARLIGAEAVRGFFTFYARFDLALLLWLCAHIGAAAEDARVAEMVAFVRTLQGPFGFWEYPAHPEVTRWVTFDLVRTLAQLDQGNGADWLSMEPRTPFQTYARLARRY